MLAIDPPGVQAILLDLTIEPGQEFTGSFADFGITIWRIPTGLPWRATVRLAGSVCRFPVTRRTACRDVSGLAHIDLDSATDSLTFETGSFNDIFGTFGSGPNDVIPTGFRIFFSKSTDQPLTVYVDNVRTIVPEPTAGLLVSLGLLSVLATARRQR